MQRVALLGVAGLVALMGATKPAHAQVYYGWGYGPPMPPAYMYPYIYDPYGYDPYAYVPRYNEPAPRRALRPRRAERPMNHWRPTQRVHQHKLARHRSIGRVAPRGLVNPLLGPLPAR